MLKNFFIIIIYNISDFLSHQTKKEQKEHKYFSRILAGSNRVNPYLKESPRKRAQVASSSAERSTAQDAGTIPELPVVLDEDGENTYTVAGSTEITQMTGSSQPQPSSLGKRGRDNDEGT